MHSASWKGHPDIVELLLERGTEHYNLKYRIGSDKEIERVKLWLTDTFNEKIGARTDIQNNEKQTPADLARDPDVGRLLRGAVGK